MDHAGGAADGETGHVWPKQEQRTLCRACQEAVAAGHLAEVVRLLQRLQLGQQIVGKDVAWRLVEVQCLNLLTSLTPSNATVHAVHPHRGLAATMKQHSWACMSWYEAAHAKVPTSIYYKHCEPEVLAYCMQDAAE